MSFREKIAWLMLVLLGGAALWYLAVLHGLGGGAPPAIGTLLQVAGLLTIGSIIGSVVLAILARDEAQAPADERERLVALKAGRAAHLTLICGVLAALGWFALFGSGLRLFHFVFASLIVAQTVDYAAQVFLLRRGA